jgi:hypothetical protein
MRKKPTVPFQLPKWPPPAPPHCGMHDCETGHVHDIVVMPNNPYVAYMMCREGCSGHESAPVMGRIPCGHMFNAALVGLN